MSGNPIRILHVFGRLDRGGAETMVMNLYRSIDRTNVQFDFIVHTTDKCNYDDEIKSLGGQIYNVPRYIGRNHWQYKKAWNLFFANYPQYRIIHGHVRSTASIYLKIAKRYGLTTIAHSHNTSSGKGISAIVKKILQYPIRYTADYFFTCSRPAGEWLFGTNACQGDNFYIVNNSIDAKKFIYNSHKRNRKRNEFNVENKFVIGHIARFHPQKNHSFLIDVFKLVLEEKKNAVLILVGDGELRSEIESKVIRLGLQDNIIFTGVCPDIHEILQAMDIFVFPSLYEGLGIVVIEAQAAGLQCIVSDTLPNEVYITDLVESFSISQPHQVWADAILRYANGYERRNTYEQIKFKGYDILKNAKWLQEFYCSTLTNTCVLDSQKT